MFCHVKRSVTILHGLPDCVSVLSGSRAVPLGPSILVLTSTSLSDSVSPADLPRFYFDFDCDDVVCHVLHYTIIIDIVKGKLQFILEKNQNSYKALHTIYLGRAKPPRRTFFVNPNL